MEQTALILIAITLFLLVVIVGLLALLVFKMLKQHTSAPVQPSTNEDTGEAPRPDISRDKLHPEILNRIKSLEKVKTKRADLFCPNHSEEPGETVCGICDRLFCKACIKPFKSMHLCKEHFPLMMKHEWEEVLTLKTSTEHPEQGVRLYDFKKEIFEGKDLPTFVETHYKINVDHDYIETYLVMYGIRESVEEIKNLLPADVATRT